MRFRRLAPIALFLWASSAWAGEREDFEKARVAYLKKDYIEASARFEAMLDPKTGSLKTPELVHEAQFSLGAAKWQLNDKDRAHAVWELLIRDTKGQYKPDPLTYPSNVINDYIDEVGRLSAAINQQNEQEAAERERQREKERKERERLEARVKELEKLTAVETVEVKGSRLVALLPFGVGQFQNGKTALGVFFLTTETVAVLATVGYFIGYRINVDQYNTILSDPTPMTPHQRQTQANQFALVAQDLRTLDLITLGVLGALMIGGIAEAQIDFRPSYEYQRPRKQKAVLLPSFAPIAGGAQIGLLGRF